LNTSYATAQSAEIATYPGLTRVTNAESFPKFTVRLRISSALLTVSFYASYTGQKVRSELHESPVFPIRSITRKNRTHLRNKHFVVLSTERGSILRVDLENLLVIYGTRQSLVLLAHLHVSASGYFGSILFRECPV